MFRALVYQRSSIKNGPIADLAVLKATPNEDLTQKATSSITCVEVPSNVQETNIVRIYDISGTFMYDGVVIGVEGNVLKCSQFYAIFNDNMVEAPAVDASVIEFFNTTAVSNVIGMYLKGKIVGYASTLVNSSGAFITRLDKDVADSYKGIAPPIEQLIFDETSGHVQPSSIYPCPIEKRVINLEQFIYDTYNSYNRIVKPMWLNEYLTYVGEYKLALVIAKAEGSIHIPNGPDYDFSEKVLFDTYENISNISILKKDEDVNTVHIYDSTGTQFIRAVTILNDGSYVEINENRAIPNRVGCNKTDFIFADNDTEANQVYKKIPQQQYNHKITFDIQFNDNLKFNDFMLGQKIKFYDTKNNRVFDTVLTAWKYNIEENYDVIRSATFTLGKTRVNMTSVLNKRGI